MPSVEVGRETRPLTTPSDRAGNPSRDPEVVEKLINDIEATYGVGEATYDRLVAKRDRRTTATPNALKSAP
jgi:ketoreductase RED1